MFAKCHRHCFIPASQQRVTLFTLLLLGMPPHYVWLPQHNRQSQSLLRTRDKDAGSSAEVLCLTYRTQKSACLPGQLTQGHCFCAVRGKQVSEETEDDRSQVV